MANTARLSVEFINQPIEGETFYIGFFDGSGTLLRTISGEATTFKTGSSYFNIGAVIEETAYNFYQYILTKNNAGYLVGMSDNITIELQAEQYGRDWGIYTQDGSGWGAMETNGKVNITVLAEEQPAASLIFNHVPAQIQSKCDFTRIYINQEAGSFPRTIHYSVYGTAQQKTASEHSELWV